MSKRLEKTFRRITTRFGQLPLLVLVILAYALSSFVLHQSSLVDRNINMAFDLMQIYQYANVHNNNILALLQRRPGATVLLCVALFCSYLFGSLVKLCYYKPRPNEQAYKNLFQKIDASSFPSVHTSNSFIVAFFGVYSWLTNNSFLYAALWFLFFAIISLSRIALKKHHPIDILAGVIFGMCIVALVAAYATYIIKFIAFLYPSFL
jgi:membrane-associated phospholipid phosphatase